MPNKNDKESKKVKVIAGVFGIIILILILLTPIFIALNITEIKNWCSNTASSVTNIAIEETTKITN